jgi:pimeloyl-ACP methyl ester carboxylesterase
MDIILIPGLWLDGASWSRVIPLLERAGHRAHPVTLPGMERLPGMEPLADMEPPGPGYPDRPKVAIDDWTGAVTRTIDAAVADSSGPGGSDGRKVAVVGHSAGSGVATAAVDARADRVARVFYVGGFPARDGEPLMRGFEVRDGEVPFPGIAGFDDADVADLDETARAEFAARAIPAPECIVRDPLHLSDERRYGVPATAVCPEYTAEALGAWIAAGEPTVQEFAKIETLDYADLRSGHWPQFTRPDDLAKIILDRL